jgi:hypothetical protein
VNSAEDIEKAIAQLPPKELAAFRAWFEVFDQAAFDEKIEPDAASGKFDCIADEAITDHRAGHSREL